MRVDPILPLALVVAFGLLIRTRTPRIETEPRLAWLATVGFAGFVVFAVKFSAGYLDVIPLVLGSLLLLPSSTRFQAWEKRFASLLESRWTAGFFGGLTAFLVWWIWGTLRPIPVYHDEAAYLLQAGLFARGRWTAPAPPIPEFFEQMHVLVVPVLAAKYPPGHSLLLAPGAAVGLPGLVPVILAGLTGTLTFALARRISNCWVALATWVFWITAPTVLKNLPSFFSEISTGALWLLAWWALLEWRDTSKSRWLIVLGVAVAWGLITRPLTMLLFTIPASIVTMRLVIERRAWRDLVAAVLAGAGVLSILPLWSARTTGDWKTTPLSLYTRLYMPYDVPGFGPRFDSAIRPLPADLARVNDEFTEIRRRYVPGALPAVASRKAGLIAQETWSGRRSFLALFGIIGLFTLPVEGWIALGTAALLFLGYLSYWFQTWTLYYLEIQPILAFLAAVGLWRVLSTVSHRQTPEGFSFQGALAISIFATYFFGASFLPGHTIPTIRSEERLESAGQRYFRDLLRQLERVGRSVVFVHYSPDHYGNRSLIVNDPDLVHAQTWVVHDRGAENKSLLRLAPDRRPYVYDESRGELVSLRSEHGR